LDSQPPAPPDQTTTPEPSALKSFAIVAAIAVVIVLAILAFLVFGLGMTSLLPFNYQGFDQK
jgi:uncharacterized RDD family membrane protein YckC